MLMIYSILNKHNFENMAENQIFLAISVSRRNAVKTWVFIKVDKNICYTYLNISIFPYTQLYT